jgi:hypothetical protein
LQNCNKSIKNKKIVTPPQGPATLAAQQQWQPLSSPKEISFSWVGQVKATLCFISFFLVPHCHPKPTAAGS